MSHTERNMAIIQGKASIRLIFRPVSSLALAEQLGAAHTLCQSIWENKFLQQRAEASDKQLITKELNT